MKRINYVVSNEKSVFSWRYIVKTNLLNIFFTVFLMVFASFVFYKFKLSVDKIKYTAYAVYILSFFFCGFMTGVTSELPGWKGGFYSGVLWIAILLLIGLYDGLTFGAGNVLRIIFGLVTSVFGGIFGVNYRYSRKKNRNKKHK